MIKIGILSLLIFFANQSYAQVKKCGVTLTHPFDVLLAEAQRGEAPAHVSVESLGITLPPGWSGYITTRKAGVFFNIGYETGHGHSAFTLRKDSRYTADTEVARDFFSRNGRIAVDVIRVRGTKVLERLRARGLHPEIRVTTDYSSSYAHRNLESATQVSATLTELTGPQARLIINEVSRNLIKPL